MIFSKKILKRPVERGKLLLLKTVEYLMIFRPALISENYSKAESSRTVLEDGGQHPTHLI